MKINKIKKGVCLKLNAAYPIYEDYYGGADKVCGYTEADDIAEVTYIAPEYKTILHPMLKISDDLELSHEEKIQDGYYIELVLRSGRYAGYDCLALNEEDMKVAREIKGAHNYGARKD